MKSEVRSQKSEDRKKAISAGKAGERGPERTVTLAVVRRVAARMADGLTLDLALSLEEKEISEEAFHKALQRDAKLSTHLRRGKARWVLKFCRELRKRGEMVDKRWLASRRHPDLFGESVSLKHEGEVQVGGLAKEVVELAREMAMGAARGDAHPTGNT